MKKFILFSILSVLFYSAPGYTAKNSKEAATDMAAALKEEAAEALAAQEAKAGLTRLETSVKKFEAQAITFGQRLVDVFQAWEQETDEAQVKVCAAQAFIGVRRACNPLFLLSGARVLEEKIAVHAESIAKYACDRVTDARKEEASALIYLSGLSERLAPEEAAAQGKTERDKALFIELWKKSSAPLATEVPGGDNPLLFERVKRGGIPLARTLQDIGDISKQMLEEEINTLANMLQEYCQLLGYDMQHQEAVKDLLDEEHNKVQQSFNVVLECYELLFNQRAAKFDGAHPTVDLVNGLWAKCNALVGFVNKNADEMSERCSQNIAFVRQQQEAAAKAVAAPADGVEDPA